jgi:hypothetical protein
MKHINVTIEGNTPLLMHAFTGGDSVSNGSSKVSAAAERGTPKQQASQGLYLADDGETICMPQPNMLKCIIEGGKFFKNGKSKITTLKTSLIPACVFLDEIEYPIYTKDVDGDWEVATKSGNLWQVDTRPVVIPATGGRVMRHRPKFDPWKLSFSMALDIEEMSVAVLRDVVDAAGSKIGLGDFRPACKGPFGRWKVINWDVQN